MVFQEQQKLISAAEFWEISHLPEYADKALELVEGVIVEMSRPGAKHGYIIIEFGSYLRQHTRENNLGYITAELGYVIGVTPDGKDTVRGPDIAFVRLESLPNGLPGEYIPFPPDLVVEVVSPHDLALEIDKKVQEYLQAGVRLIWVVYPFSKTVIVHRPGSIAALDIHGTLDGEDVLPGFKLSVADIFPKSPKA